MATAPQKLLSQGISPLRRVLYTNLVSSFLKCFTRKTPLGYSGYDHDMDDLPKWVRFVVREEWTAEVFDEEMIRGGECVEEEM
ncbi:putative inactive receptor kinase, partial [Trifolium medium]|nr:putative inactive receptor kinase [Trifolium medium]